MTFAWRFAQVGLFLRAPLALRAPARGLAALRVAPARLAGAFAAVFFAAVLPASAAFAAAAFGGRPRRARPWARIGTESSALAAGDSGRSATFFGRPRLGGAVAMVSAVRVAPGSTTLRGRPRRAAPTPGSGAPASGLGGAIATGATSTTSAEAERRRRVGRATATIGSPGAMLRG
ncbi:MAG: hypothetical protein ACREM2_09065, partial [Vulcanimicrobiaceae bacterium]